MLVSLVMAKLYIPVFLGERFAASVPLVTTYLSDKAVMVPGSIGGPRVER